MTFPTQLHDIINDPDKEKAVLDLIQAECLSEFNRWKDASVDTIGIGAIGASSNLLCRFLGLTKEE